MKQDVETKKLPVDARSVPLEFYKACIDGACCIDTRLNIEELVFDDSDTGTLFTIEKIFMTQYEFENLPDFQGF